MRSLVALWVLVVGACVGMTLYGDVIIAGFDNKNASYEPHRAVLSRPMDVDDYTGDLNTYNPQMAGINTGQTDNPQETIKAKELQGN